MKEFDINFKSDRISVLEHVLLTSENENEKLEAINQLIRKSDDRAQLAILKALEDSFQRVREKAIQSIKLSSIPDEIFVPSLVKLLDDEFPKIREKAIQLLKEMAKEEFLPYFQNKLNDESDLVRAIAIQAIGKIGHRGGFESLITQFHSETSPLTKRSLLQNIARIGGETTINFLITILRNTNEMTEVRSEAALALAKSGSSKALNSITSVLNSAPSSYLKLRLIQPLAFIHEEKTVDFLIELFTDEFQKRNFQISSVKLLDPWNYEFKVLDDSAKIISTVIKTLGILGHKKAIPFLLNTLNSVYNLIRIQSVAALFQFNDVSINERLISIVSDKNEGHRFKEMMLAVMNKINKESLTNLGLSMNSVNISLYRKFIDEFFI